MAAETEEPEELVEYQVLRGKPSWDGKTYHKGDILKLSPEFVHASGLSKVLGKVPIKKKPAPPQMDGNFQRGDDHAPIPLPRVQPTAPGDKFPVQPPTMEEITGLPAIKDSRKLTGEAVTTLEIERPQPQDYIVNVEVVPSIEAELLDGGEDPEDQITVEELEEMSWKELCKMRRELGTPRTGQKRRFIIADIRQHLGI